MRKAFTLLLVAVSFSLQAQQGMKQRLIAQADYSDDGRRLDSVSLSYSGSRHSAFDYNTLQYFDLRYGFNGGETIVGKVNRIVRPNNYDSTDHSLRIAFDTLRYYDKDHLGQDRLFFVEAASYFPDGKCAGTYHNRIGYGSYATTFLYLYNLLVREHYVVHAGFGKPEQRSERYIIYDASGNPVIDSNGYFNPGGTTIFEYDANGRYSKWYPARLYLNEFSYYPDGKVRSRLASVPDSGIAEPRYLDSFSYTPGVPGYSGVRTFVVTPDTAAVINTVSYHVNHLGQKDTMTSVPAGSPDSKTVVHVVYNSRGNPESRTDAHYNHGQLVSARKSIYYYEDYDPALDASSFSPREAAITIYPNPTTGAITLSYPDAAPGAALLVQVTNAAGQVVHAEAFTVAGPSRKIQLAADAAPGTYYFSVYGVHGALLYSKSVLKL